MIWDQQKRIRALAIVAFLALVAVGCGSSSGSKNANKANTGTSATSAAPTKSPIVIGSFGSISGPLAAVDEPAHAAALAWAEDINARGGLNGHPVKLIYRDDGLDPTKTLAIVRGLVEDDGAVALFGAAAPVTTDAILPYLESKHVPLIGTLPVPSQSTSPWVFNAITSSQGLDRAYLTQIALATDGKAKKIAFIYCKESPACLRSYQEAQKYASTLGMQIVYGAEASLFATDYTAQVVEARSHNADAVVFGLSPANLVRFASDAARQGWKPLIAGSTAAYDPAVLDAGAATEGVIAPAEAAPWSLSPAMAPYRDAMNKYQAGKPLGNYGADVWNGGQILEAIAPKLGDTVSSADIVAALQALPRSDFKGTVAPVTLGSGVRSQSNMCHWVVQVKSGKFVALNDGKYICANDDGLKKS